MVETATATTVPVTTLRLIAIIFLAAAMVGQAQDAAQPSVNVSPTPPDLIPSPAASLPSESPAAVSSPAVPSPNPAEQSTPALQPSPSASPVLPELSALDQAFNQTGLGKEADERRTHIEMRKLQNEVARDPGVIAAKTAADHAPTDLEKRRLLREYYNINFSLMSQRASSAALKAAIDQSKREHIGLLAQPKVRPENGAAAAAAAPTPKKKKPHPHKRF